MKAIFIRIGILAILLGSVHLSFAGGFAEDAEFRYRDITELEIDAAMFDLAISSAAGNEVIVTVIDIPRGITVADSSRADRAHVFVRGRNSWMFRSSGDPRIRVDVPAGIDLDLELGSGDCDLTGVRGRIVIRAGSGDVRLRDAGGTIGLSTGSGDIDIDRTVGDHRIESGSGDVQIAGSVGQFSIGLASGDVDGRDLELRGDTQVSTASGDIDLRLKNRLENFTYRLNTASGDLEWGNTRGSRLLEGGDGRYQLFLETSSGSISVR